MNDEVFDLFNTLEPRKVKLKVQGKPFVLYEASADAAVKYRNALARGSQLTADSDGNFRRVVLSGVEDADPMLVSCCLYWADDNFSVPLDANGNPDPRKRVPDHKVRSWPASVMAWMVRWIKEQSPDLTDKVQKAEDVEKEIGRLQKKLQGMKNDTLPNGEPADPTSASPESTTTVSDSVMSSDSRFTS